MECLITGKRKGERNRDAADQVRCGDSSRTRAHGTENKAEARVNADFSIVARIGFKIVGLYDPPPRKCFAQRSGKVACLFHAAFGGFLERASECSRDPAD